MLWKVNGQDLNRVPSSTLSELGFREQSLEEWIERRPEFLGEPLLIIGRQVQIAGFENRIDLLAVDREGKLVAIEVKRDTVDVPAEFQALRYVAALANWSYERIKNQAETYHRSRHPDTTQHFQELVDSFFEFEEEVNLNEDQRIIIVGRNVHERLISVAGWLSSRNVNVKIVEVSLFVDEKCIFIFPNVILPKESIQATDASEGQVGRPWDDGKKWHLEERCSSKTAPLMQTIADKIPAIVTIEGMSWNQRVFVAFRLHGRNWLAVNTGPNQLVATFTVAAGSFSVDDVTRLLGVVVYDRDTPLADRLGTPSSVDIERREAGDKVRLRIKPGFSFETEGFAEFVRLVHRAARS